MTAVGGITWWDEAWRRPLPNSSLQGFWAAVAVAIAACVSVLLYAASTWGEPNRETLLGIFGVALAGCIASAAIPAIRQAWNERRGRTPVVAAMFALWVITVGAALDGGADSQLTLLYFLPVVYGALAFPLRAVLAVAAAGLLSYLVLGLSTGPAALGDLSFFGSMLGCLVLAGVLHAREVERQHGLLADLSRTDPLTGALNRRGFRERAVAEVERARRDAKPFSLCVLDLDGFKEVNDTRGHLVGDELLRWTVETLNELLRGTDSVGRLGGDEFALLLPGSDGESVRVIARRAREALAPRISASVGFASFPEDGGELTELEARADVDLGRAKAGTETPGRRELAWARALADAAEGRMGSDGDHGEAVATQAMMIARHMGWEGAEVSRLRVAALLHDVGKLGVPETILRKPAALTAAEYAQVQTHAALGAELISRVDGMEAVAVWIRHSHEHFDGSGYPDALAGEDIPLASRIIHVADAFDAMTRDRPYRQGMPPEKAVEELRRCAGKQFDPDCVEAFLAQDAQNVVLLEPSSNGAVAAA